MKVQCIFTKRETRRTWRTVPLWRMTLPFNVNPRGIFVHRVRCAGSILEHDGHQHSHDWAHYWCGNQTCGEGVSLTDSPPDDRLLCARCEAMAVAAGQPTADELLGRHIHIGSARVVRECCRTDHN